MKLRSTILAAAAVTTACRPPAPMAAPATPVAECAEPELPAALATAGSIVVTAPFSPRTVLDPSNPVARLAFDRAYETLVRLDCTGRVVPALATAWREDGRALTLRIRDSVSFWYQPNVTAADVISSWHASATATRNRLVRLVADSSRALDDRTIEIRVAGITPRWLADPMFVVARRTGFGFPDGTRPSVLRDSPLGGGSNEALARYTLSPAPPGLAEIYAAKRGAARDLIDLGRAIVVSNDAALNMYAGSQPEYASLPLQWDRTWVLMVPTRRDPDRNAEPDAAAWHAFRESLARNLVGDDARPAATPAWLGAARLCAGAPPATATPLRILDRVTIAHSADDAVARAIAERLVALGGAERRATDATVMHAIAPVLRIAGIGVAAVALDADDFARALIEEREYAFVLSIPSRSTHPCLEAASPLGALAWLVDGGELHHTMLIPLIETRWRALVRGAANEH